MTLTVGTNSYLNVSDANAYWLARNNSTWASASDAEKEKALIEATQFLDGAYSFIGTHPEDTQLLAWPRKYAYVNRGNLKGVKYASDTVPPQITNACAELALEALSANLRPSLDRGGSIKKEKVDSLEIEYNSFAPAQKTYDMVTLILKPLLLAGSGASQVRLERS